MSLWVCWPQCYTQSTFLKNCHHFLLSDVQHLETESSWETIVMLITLWFSRSKTQSHILNTTAQMMEPTLFISTLAKLLKQSLSLFFHLFLPNPSPQEKDPECHRSIFPHISKHKCVSSSHSFVSFSLLFSQESWCHFKELMSWETLWAPISHSLSLVSLSLLSQTFWLKPRPSVGFLR